jgi:hypothetical protein
VRWKNQQQKCTPPTDVASHTKILLSRQQPACAQPGSLLLAKQLADGQQFNSMQAQEMGDPATIDKHLVFSKALCISA